MEGGVKLVSNVMEGEVKLVSKWWVGLSWSVT